MNSNIFGLTALRPMFLGKPKRHEPCWYSPYIESNAHPEYGPTLHDMNCSSIEAPGLVQQDEAMPRSQIQAWVSPIKSGRQGCSLQGVRTWLRSGLTTTDNYVYISVCMCISKYIHTHKCICSVFMSISLPGFIYTYIDIRKYLSAQIKMCIYIHISMYMQFDLHKSVSTHILVHIHLQI